MVSQAFQHMPSAKHRSTDCRERELSLDKLQAVYHLPISKAAAALNIGVTVLKKYCRWYSIERWPYRKIRSVDKLMQQMQKLETDEVVAQVQSKCCLAQLLTLLSHTLCTQSLTSAAA